MHSIKEKPVVVDGQIVIRPIMVVALTYDHRLLDGREGTTLLGTPSSSFSHSLLTSLVGPPAY
jgi:pyruvate/2-oxoglutarate dehydrogenase complex dihydrolipoamide acyltransferase (E2) component